MSLDYFRGSTMPDDLAYRRPANADQYGARAATRARRRQAARRRARRRALRLARTLLMVGCVLWVIGWALSTFGGA
jgi:fatty acid desaturase